MGGQAYRCAWCRKKIPSGAEVYGLGVRLKEELRYREAVGKASVVHLPAGGRELECMVTADGSQARQEGWDIIFMTCSEKCGRELKNLLEEERQRLFEEIM
ncbi:MAG: hypothetical protein H5T74_09530 [Actinobacteria bacterium]|nr:hypothetical protein [Actinomycetota bacterium]MDI6830411.1 hypothetical protein [Actinomycetota bacterium]